MQRNLKTGVLLASAFIAIAVTGSVLFAPDGYDHYNYDGENDVGTKVTGSLFAAGFAIAAAAAYFSPDAHPDYDYDGLNDGGAEPIST